MFQSRTPTTDELENCPHLELTSVHEWNPHNLKMNESPSIDIQTITSNNMFADPTFNNLKECLSNLIQEQYSIAEAIVKRVQPRQSFISHDRHKQITADRLAEHFGIGPARARATLRATTQRGVRSAILPISRRYRADKYFNVKTLDGKFATDTLWSKSRSTGGNIASQVYTHKNGFATSYHLSEATGDSLGYSLSSFINDYGRPAHLTFDGIPTQTGHSTLFMQTIRRAQIPYHVSTPYCPNENPAEGCIREIKRRLYHLIH